MIKDQQEAGLDILSDGQMCIGYVLKFIDPSRVTITTDCGMKQLPRPCAVQKLRAMVAGTKIVRAELGHVRDADLDPAV